MTPSEIVNTLSGLGIAVGVQGDNLTVVPKSKVPAGLVVELARHKAEIMALVLGEPARRAKLRGSPLSAIGGLLGKDIAAGFYKPPGKGQPRMPLNGRGTTVLEASGLCSPGCDHEFGADTSEEVADDNRS